MQKTVETFKGMLIPVPAELLQVSNKISAVLSPVSMVAKSWAEIHNIFIGVQSLQQNMKGPFIPPQYIIAMYYMIGLCHLIAGDDSRMAGGEARITGDYCRPEWSIHRCVRTHSHLYSYIYGLVALLDNIQSSFSSITISTAMCADYDRRRNRRTTAMAISAGTPETTAGHPIEASEGNWGMVPANVRVSDLG